MLTLRSDNANVSPFNLHAPLHRRCIHFAQRSAAGRNCIRADRWWEMNFRTRWNMNWVNSEAGNTFYFPARCVAARRISTWPLAANGLRIWGTEVEMSSAHQKSYSASRGGLVCRPLTRHLTDVLEMGGQGGGRGGKGGWRPDTVGEQPRGSGDGCVTLMRYQREVGGSWCEPVFRITCAINILSTSPVRLQSTFTSGGYGGLLKHHPPLPHFTPNPRVWQVKEGGRSVIDFYSSFWLV